jgi:hypothetical protein
VNTIEDRLRDAYHAAAETIRPETIGSEAVHPLGTEDMQRVRPARRLARHGARALIPLGAATGVAVIAVAVSMARPGPVPTHRQAGTGHFTVPSGPSTPNLGYLKAAAGPPRFFLAIEDNGGGSPYEPLAVFSASTGRELTALSTPRSRIQPDAAAATRDDRTFVVASTTGPAAGSACQGWTSLYRLRLTSLGRLASLIRLAVPPIRGAVDELVVTPDGRTAAYAGSSCKQFLPVSNAIGVVDIASKQARQWAWPGRGQAVDTLAISADGREVTYGASPVIGQGDEVHVSSMVDVSRMPADTPSGSPAPDSHLVMRIGAEPFAPAVATANGVNLYYCALANPAVDHVIALREYNVSTGATTVLAHFDGGSFCQLGMSGHYLLLGYSAGLQGTSSKLLVRYDLSTGASRPVPRPRPWLDPLTSIPW